MQLIIAFLVTADNDAASSVAASSDRVVLVAQRWANSLIRGLGFLDNSLSFLFLL